MIKTDKILHFLVGFFIYTTIATFFPFYVAAIAVILAGVGKEMYDIDRTGFDIKDLSVTLIGGIAAYLLTLLA